MASSLPRIAIVDDDESVRRALGRLLRVLEYAPEAYASAADFIAAVGSDQPDCLIADFHMPNMTGLELYRHLVAADIHIPTIIITAHDTGDTRRQCQNAGVFAFLTKPIASGEFSATIAAALQAA